MTDIEIWRKDFKSEQPIFW